MLQDDDEMIFQNDGTGGRIVVRKFELWVPQLTLTSGGQKQVNENFLKPAQWTYLKETLHSSLSRRDACALGWLITAGVKNRKHVFVFFQQTRKQNALTQNPYTSSTLLTSMETTQQNCLLVASSMGPVSTLSWTMMTTSNCGSSTI